MAANSKHRLIRVPSAAPATPMAGAPSLPKMNSQLKKILMKNAPTDTMRGMCICLRLRSTMVVVVDSPNRKKQGSAQYR